jgi:hypothetical protein
MKDDWTTIFPAERNEPQPDTLMKKLLTITAIIEAATGLGLLMAPTLLAQLLLGGTLDTPAALTVARVGAAALLAISVACWLSRENGRALVIAMLLYNVVVVAILVHAALALALSGPGLWPAIALHLAFAFWCIACLQRASKTA